MTTRPQADPGGAAATPPDLAVPLRLAIAGKGGSGKTTIAGTLARILGSQGRRVVAVDADTNPNLSTVLGISREAGKEIAALPRTLLTRETQPDGSVKSTFTRDPVEVLEEYGTPGPDRVQLVVMGAVGHGGAG